MLVPVLEDARRLGFLGPGPIDVHLDHAAGFAEVVARLFPPGTSARGLIRAADLGSGGGVPALPLALAFPGVEWVLVESAMRRAAFLRDAVERLGVSDRVAVVETRAEEIGRSAAARGRFDLIVARSFGPPAVVAECGAPLMRVGGRAVISEPPGGEPARWPAAALGTLGMAPHVTVHARNWAYQVLAQVSPCPDRYPRRVGVPVKRPLF